MKQIILILLSLAPSLCKSQEKPNSLVFWENLKNQCGKSYVGTPIAGADNETFKNKRLVMQVISCQENVIKIPFYVGEDKSRTWVFTLKGDKIELKHDHIHENGEPDKVTMYGGISSNSGQAGLQMFPADDATAKMLPLAATNVWWVELNDDFFSYNLRRIGSDRLFTVKFDLKNPIQIDWKPWGWK
ncbi:MAG TPA: hypothetical protein VK175_07205 [Leadbetterella sp.]|nr:hypothetical protein [Leadbetterella sp.]